MDEREKIINIIEQTEDIWHEADRMPFGDEYHEIKYGALANALIAANIGDVTEYKEIIRDLNTDVVAYRALCKADDLEQIIEGQKSLIDEYEHRAEVAEKERDKWKERGEKAEKERDEYRKSTHIALRGIEILKRNILRYFATEFPSILQQAEREIEEEKND